MNNKCALSSFTACSESGVLFTIFSIPHSMFGSEFNYATGSVTQG